MKTWQLGILFGSFMVGVAVATLLECNYVHVLWILLLALVVGLYRSRSSEARPAAVLLVICLSFVSFAAGILRTESYEQKFVSTDLDMQVDSEITFVGIVSKEPDVRDQLQMLTVDFEQEVVLVSTDKSIRVLYGDEVTVSGVLEIPENFTTDLDRTFDYKNYLKAKGVRYRISFAEVEVLSNNNKNIFITKLLAVKQLFMSQLDQVLIEPAGSLADGLLLGVDKGLGDQLEEDFRRSGIIHIVVLSGYNVMLVVVFVLFILSFFIRSKWKLLFGLLAIVAFALLVGLSATVVRASVMASLLLIAQTLRRTYDVLRALLFAGFVMVVVNPYILLFDIGFQLSFMATVGIILALPFFAHNDQPEALGFSLRSYVVATVSTQIAVLPLLVYHIGEVSLVAVIVNVLVLPVVPFVMLLSFITGMVNFVSPTLASLVGYPTQFLLEYIIYVAQLFASFSFSTTTLPVLSAWWVLVMYAVLVMGYILLRNPAVLNINNGELSDWTIEEETESGSDRRSDPLREEVPKIFR